MKDNFYVVIMAGGVGSRFWPASRENMPKQFLDILGVGKSLIRLTFERFNKRIPAERILVITNKTYKSLVMEHIPELPEINVLTEPSRNNTAPCIAYTSLRLAAIDEDASFIVAPSDHVILKEETFLDNVEFALEYVSQNDAILTLAIQPTRPDTGYGYIESHKGDLKDGIQKVISFKEKPTLETAKQYLNQGSFYWNAGIFVWSVKTILKSFEKNANDIYSLLTTDIAKYNTSEEQEYIDQQYPLTPSISVDYAILEKANNVYTLPVNIGWSDLGTWNALHSYKEKDENGSVIIGANTRMIDSSNCIVRSDAQKMVIIKGLSDYIIIDEEDVLLVYPKSDEQGIKALKKSIEDQSYI